MSQTQVQFLTINCIYLFFLLFGQLFSQNTIKAVYVDTPPRIDGKVVEDVWSLASAVDKFYQREPDTGEPVSEKTVFFVCYDKNNLYIAARCYDNPELIAAQQLERDASLGNDDKIVIILDTFLDRRNAFWFQMNALGCIGDAILSLNGAALNKQWDGLWEGRASINKQGWDIEVAIPFKTLNFPANQNEWGIKFSREIQRRSEKSYWPEANLNSYKFQVSDAAVLSGLKDISQGIGLDLRPYALVGLDQKAGEKHKFPNDAGLDIFYQLTPGIKSALTINTDFAQTEVDNRQINLTRFPLFFPEKRDFFLDGANYFQFGREGDSENKYAQRLLVFFSRRLGLDSESNPIPIVAGAKITGQSGHWNIGFMDVVDDRSDGKQNFAIARITHNFGSQSVLGLIGTSGNAMSDDHNYVMGADIKLATSTFQENKNLSLLLYGLKSNTQNIDNNDFSFGGEVNYPNDFLSFRAGYNQIEKNFTAGIGFVPRKDIRNFYTDVGLGPRPQKWGILQLQFTTSFDYITNMQNRMLSRGFSLSPVGIRTNSGDNFSFQMNNQYEYLEEDDVISSIELNAGIYEFSRYQLILSTAKMRNFWSTIQYAWGDFYNGKQQTISMQCGYKISVPIFIGFDLAHTDGTLSGIDFTREVYRAKIDILFSPRITFNNFIQYDNFTETMGWQSRFRWILKPGNEINLVWNSISEDPFERFRITQSAARAKFQYNYRF